MRLSGAPDDEQAPRTRAIATRTPADVLTRAPSRAARDLRGALVARGGGGLDVRCAAAGDLRAAGAARVQPGRAGAARLSQRPGSVGTKRATEAELVAGRRRGAGVTRRADGPGLWRGRAHAAVLARAAVVRSKVSGHDAAEDGARHADTGPGAGPRWVRAAYRAGRVVIVAGRLLCRTGAGVPKVALAGPGRANAHDDRW